MTWQQVIRFTPKGYDASKDGPCLQFVEDCFGFSREGRPFRTAIESWQKSHQIKGEPPLGIDVPIYFTLKSDWRGHVAVRLADGRVASSSDPGIHSQPTYHANIAAIIKYYGTTNGLQYLGWSDELIYKKVVKEVATVEKMEQPRTCYTPKDNKVHFFNKKEVLGAKQTLISPDGTRAAYPNEVVNLEVLEQPRWMTLPERKNEKCYVAAKAKQSKLVLIYDGKGYTQYKNV
jgi:hypothetical protein